MPPPTPHQQQQQRRRRSSPSPPPPPPPPPQPQPPPLPPPHDDQTSSATKRKRRDDGAVDPREVTDAEVEEFYAILRRVHCAAPRPRRAPPAAAWSPAFAWEDFAVGDGTLTASVAAEKDAAPRALDLNADPEETEADRGGDEN